MMIIFHLMNNIDELTGIFRELSLENQSRLLECSRISQIAENAIKRAFSGRRSYDVANGGNRERAVPPGEGRL
jgi:hypothetical protein